MLKLPPPPNLPLAGEATKRLAALDMIADLA